MKPPQTPQTAATVTHPPAPPRATQTNDLSGWFHHAPLWGTLLGVVLILFARVPDRFTNPQFWAEDGHFFERDWVLGARALFLQYAGYLHFIPRLTAFLTRLSVDPLYYPVVYNGVALAGALVVAARGLSPRVPWRGRPAVVLLLFLVPDAHEILMNLTNVQWFFAAGLVFILVSDDPTTGGQRSFDLLAVLLWGLTGPFVLIFLPLFLTRALLRRNAWNYRLLSVATVAAAVQLYFFVSTGAGAVTPATTTLIAALRDQTASLGLRVFGSWLTGTYFNAQTSRWGWVAIALLGTAVMVWLAARRGPDRQARLLLLGAGALMFGGALYRMRSEPAGLLYVPNAARYVILPEWIALTLVVISWGKNRLANTTIAAVVLVCLLANAPRFRAAPFVDTNWSSWAAYIRRGKPITFPINPAGWTVPFPGGRP